MSDLLSSVGLSKRFSGVLALDGVDFSARAGEIHALMGENGAGKSTLIKVLTGVYPRDSGELFLQGQPVHPTSPLHAQKLGISTVYQEVNLVPALSVAENLFLGRFPLRLGGWGGINWSRMHRHAADALARLDVHVDVTQPLQSYSTAIQQMVAIARAVDCQSKVLVLDEPTSSLDMREVEQLFSAMRRLRADGICIIFVTHFLDQLYEVSDRVTVLRNGRLVGTYNVSVLPRLELISRMIGRDASEVSAREAGQPAKGDSVGVGKLGAVCISARSLGRTGAIAPFDLELLQHQVTGIAGLLGSGRTELVRLLFGADRATSGNVAVKGVAVKLSSPRAAIAKGIAFTSEDRKAEGIFPDLSVRENLTIAVQARRGWLKRLSVRDQRQLAAHYIAALSIRTSDAEKPIKFLSGGNQQKVLLSRWLATDPTLLILDEPTRGIDVGAKFEIFGLMRKLCDKGMSLLLISAELDELIRSCSRVLVLRDRKVVGELNGSSITENAIMSTIASPPDSSL